MTSGENKFGMAAGEVFPASAAKSLLNPLRRLVQSPVKTVAAMCLSADARVLEIGSGPGFFSPFIAKAVPAGQAVQFDLQAEMLHLATDRLRDHANAAGVQGSGTALPFASRSFDAVLIALVLGEIDDRDAAIVDVARVLAPGGELVVCETRRDSDFIALTKLQELLDQHGFVLVARRGNRLQYTARFALQ